MLQATDKSGTSRLMRAVLCSCSFCGLSGGRVAQETDKSATEFLVNDSSVAFM